MVPVAVKIKILRTIITEILLLLLVMIIITIAKC